MGTAVVPWRADYALDEALFRHEIATLIQADYPNLYIFGTAGEGYAVEDTQFEQVARVFVDEMRTGHAEPMIGVISLEDAEVRSFFDTLLGRFEDCQFLHYNLLRTKRLVSAGEYALIAADHPNLVATKNSTDSMLRVRDLVDGAPALQHFLNEHGFLIGSLVGECGLLISMATTNLATGRCYFEAGRVRDVETLLHLERELNEIGRFFAT